MSKLEDLQPNRALRGLVAGSAMTGMPRVMAGFGMNRFVR